MRFSPASLEASSPILLSVTAGEVTTPPDPPSDPPPTSLTTRARFTGSSSSTPQKFYIKIGDTGRPLNCTLEYSDGTPIDLTGAQVFVSMRLNSRLERRIIDKKPCAIVNAGQGQVYYSWQASDVQREGTYFVEFTVVLANNAQVSFPSGPRPSNYNVIVIHPNV